MDKKQNLTILAECLRDVDPRWLAEADPGLLKRQTDPAVGEEPYLIRAEKKKPVRWPWIAAAACVCVVIGVVAAARSGLLRSPEQRPEGETPGTAAEARTSTDPEKIDPGQPEGVPVETAGTVLTAELSEMTLRPGQEAEFTPISVDTIPNTELSQEAPTEDWGPAEPPVPARSVSYEDQYGGENEDYGYRCTVLTYWEQGKALWSAEERICPADGAICLENGVLLFGSSWYLSNGTTQSAVLFRYDAKGNQLWTRSLRNGTKWEGIEAVLENPDGTLAVFSRADFNTLCFTRFTGAGEVLQETKLELGSHSGGAFGISEAIRMPAGYAVRLSNYDAASLPGASPILLLDENGDLQQAAVLTAEGQQLYVTRMVCSGDRFLLSGYLTPNTGLGEHGELSKRTIWAMSKTDPETGLCTDEAMTEALRDFYTAVLLVCDPDLTPREAYTVKGSLGGALTVGENGAMVWDVESLTNGYFSPATNSFSYAAEGRVYRYTIGPAGITVDRTGETVVYRR